MAAGSNGDIRVLHVDDEPGFAEMVASHLERASDRFEVRTETDPEAGLDAIDEDPPDCVVSDYDMPSMTGLDLLRAVRERDPELPFVLFTGKGSEEIASEAISAGVTDYIQKGGRSGTYELLANRVENAVSSYRLERAFEAEHEKLMALFENSPDPTVENRLVGDEAVVDGVNPAFQEVFGIEATEAVGGSLEDLIVPADRLDEAHSINERATEGESFRTEVRRRAEDGLRDFLLTSVPVSSGDCGFAIYTDLTEARERERRLETLVSNLPGMVYRCRNEPDWPMEFVGGDVEQLTGYEASALESGDVVWGRDALHSADEDRVWTAVQRALDEREPFEVTYRIRTRGGDVRWVWERGRGVHEEEGLRALEGYIADVTDYRDLIAALDASRDVLEALDSEAVDADDVLDSIEAALDGVRVDPGQFDVPDYDG